MTKQPRTRTRFSCILPQAPEGTVFPVYGKGTGRRRKAAEPTVPAEPHAPEQAVEATAARG